ncbi:glycosyltransferase [Agromyces sp. MMS24-K17]|uniref:glycosyltransferase n=1 Tax=Agromyces sp. MMS24-K17 TaxID=3372850 RepID=UPI003754729C
MFQGHILDAFPWLAADEHILVADVYDPMHLEALEQFKERNPLERERISHLSAEVLNAQLERADFLLCASEKQRDFWLGHLAALGRVNPATYDDDPSLRSLLAVVPFGIQEERPVRSRSAIKGTVPGIATTDKVILWGGGIYNWFDPITLVRAVAKIAEHRDDVRLYFLGVRHPNPHVPEMQVAVQTQALAAELGLTDRVVFFNTGWVEYEDRANYLLDADIGVSTHYEHLETSFSFRTRILDYLWAGLPIVSTDGDTFADLIHAHGLGRVVPPEDVDALVIALEEILDDEAGRSSITESIDEFSEQYRWSRTLAPLVEFCAKPQPAPDRRRRVALVRDRREQELHDHILNLRREVGEVQDAFAAVLVRKSWRLTAPLRSAYGFMRRTRRRMSRHPLDPA